MARHPNWSATRPLIVRDSRMPISTPEAMVPTTRPRARVEDCRDITASDMVRNDRTGDVRVDPDTYAVTLDGEPVSAPPVERVAFSDRYLLG